MEETDGPFRIWRGERGGEKGAEWGARRGTEPSPVTCRGGRAQGTPPPCMQGSPAPAGPAVGSPALQGWGTSQELRRPTAPPRAMQEPPPLRPPYPVHAGRDVHGVQSFVLHLLRHTKG